MKKLIIFVSVLFCVLGCTKNKADSQPEPPAETGYQSPMTFNCPMHTDLLVEIATDGKSARMTDNSDRVFILNRAADDEGTLFENEDGVFIKIKGERATASLTGRASFECALFVP